MLAAFEHMSILRSERGPDALTALKDRCDELLSSYPTSIEEDLQILENTESTEPAEAFKYR